LTVPRTLKYTSNVMVSPPSLLVIGAGPFQRALLQTTQRMGITTIALDGNPKATSRALADRFIVCDISDIEAVLACARDLTIDGVISTASDIALPAHAAVAARLGLPGPSPESIVVARNKLLTAERLEKAGVPLRRQPWSTRGQHLMRRATPS